MYFKTSCVYRSEDGCELVPALAMFPTISPLPARYTALYLLSRTFKFGHICKHAESEKLNMYETRVPQHYGIQLGTEKQTKGTETCTGTRKETSCSTANLWTEERGQTRGKKLRPPLRAGRGSDLGTGINISVALYYINL